MDEREDRAVREDAERERATSENRATPVRSGETPFHSRDTADALHPEEPPDRPPHRHGPDEENTPAEG